MDVSLRPGVKPDIRYIKDTWLKSFRDGEGVKDIPNSFYWRYEPRILEHIIPRCSSNGGVLVAYESLPEDATFADTVEQDILGYICAEPFADSLLVHMTYVRGHNKAGKTGGRQHRRQGIGTILLNAAARKFDLVGAPITYTYRTSMCWKEYGFRQRLRDINATYVLYPKYSLLPKPWETGIEQ